MNKAVFKYATKDKNPRDSWKHTELWYEYKGYEYCVVKHNNGYMGKPLSVQHKEAQEGIDEKIKHKDDPISKWKYEGSAQEGFDFFWKEICEEE